MTNDVLIIGAGPSGLFAAAELTRQGVRVRLVERELHLHHQARATSIQPGTLEILEAVGLLPPFLEAAEHVRGFRMYGADQSELRALNFTGIDCRHQFQCSLPQYETQRILEVHLASLGGVVERGVMANRVVPDGDGFHVDLVHADGTVETVHPGIVIGAGGAHSVTRDSMGEQLGGATYEGHFLVADVAMHTPFPRDESSVFCGPAGLLLLAPLPGGRWLTFQDLEETVQTVSAEEVGRRIELRLGGRCRPTEIAWFSPFRMHRRIVSRLAAGRCFLIGDAAHLSSPWGGEGLNAGLQDAFDLAWKLALVLRGHASQSLLDAYAVERMIADRHVLDVSDQVHRGVAEIANEVRQGRPAPEAATDPVATALLLNARAMLDIDYGGSPLVADHTGSGVDVVKPRPGQRYPDWLRPGGTSHRVLVFGPVETADSLAVLCRRWAGRVQIDHDPKVDPVRAGVPMGGVVLIRPDGHIGFRSPSTSAEALAALECHLASYLIPAPT